MPYILNPHGTDRVSVTRMNFENNAISKEVDGGGPYRGEGGFEVRTIRPSVCAQACQIERLVAIWATSAAKRRHEMKRKSPVAKWGDLLFRSATFGLHEFKKICLMLIIYVAVWVYFTRGGRTLCRTWMR